MTENEARKKWCPMAKPGLNKRPLKNMELWTDRTHCIAANCAMGWRVLYPKEMREDHSNGMEMIFKRGSETKRTPRREGPNGSLGFWILDENGYCGLGGKPNA
jgi:hypothetical protein